MSGSSATVVPSVEEEEEAKVVERSARSARSASASAAVLGRSARGGTALLEVVV